MHPDDLAVARAAVEDNPHLSEETRNRLLAKIDTGVVEVDTDVYAKLAPLYALAARQGLQNQKDSE